MEAHRQVTRQRFERICVPDLGREGSIDQRVLLKSSVTSRASRCIFSSNKLLWQYL